MQADPSSRVLSEREVRAAIDAGPGYVFRTTDMGIGEARRILHETGEIPFGFAQGEHGELTRLVTDRPNSGE